MQQKTNISNDEKEHRTDNTGLAKVAVQCSADTFVVKIATFAKPENVVRHFIRHRKYGE
jgi:peptidyl-tRNA hydrolase